MPADDLGESSNLAKPQFPPGMIILSLKKLPEDARQVSTHSGDDGIAGGLNEVLLIRNMVQRGIWSIRVSCYSCSCWKRWALDSWPQPKITNKRVASICKQQAHPPGSHVGQQPTLPSPTFRFLSFTTEVETCGSPDDPSEFKA